MMFVSSIKTKKENKIMSLFSRTDTEPAKRPSKFRKYGGPAVAALLLATAAGATEMSTTPAPSDSTSTTVSIESISSTTDTAPKSVPVDIGSAIVTPDGQTSDVLGGSKDVVRLGEGVIPSDTIPAVVGGNPEPVTNDSSVRIAGGADISIERPPVNPAG